MPVRYPLGALNGAAWVAVLGICGFLAARLQKEIPIIPEKNGKLVEPTGRPYQAIQAGQDGKSSEAVEPVFQPHLAIKEEDI